MGGMILLNGFILLVVILGLVIGNTGYWIFVNIVEGLVCIFNIYMIQKYLKSKVEISKSIGIYSFIFGGIMLSTGIGYLVDSNFLWQIFDILRLVIYVSFIVLLFRNKTSLK